MFILKVENTEKAGHNVKPRPGKMCTLTSVVRSQHAIGLQKKTICIPRTSISEYNKAFRAGWCVHSAHGVCVLQNTLVTHLVSLCALDFLLSSISKLEN